MRGVNCAASALRCRSKADFIGNPAFARRPDAGCCGINGILGWGRIYQGASRCCCAPNVLDAVFLDADLFVCGNHRVFCDTPVIFRHQAVVRSAAQWFWQFQPALRRPDCVMRRQAPGGRRQYPSNRSGSFGVRAESAGKACDGRRQRQGGGCKHRSYCLDILHRTAEKRLGHYIY